MSDRTAVLKLEACNDLPHLHASNAAYLGNHVNTVTGLQAAYVKAYLEQVQLRERQLAGNTALVVEPDRKRVKTEHATAAVPGTGLVEVVSKQEAIATGPEIKVEVRSP